MYQVSRSNSAMTCSGRRSQQINNRRRLHSLRVLCPGPVFGIAMKPPLTFTGRWRLMAVKQQELVNESRLSDRSRPILMLLTVACVCHGQDSMAYRALSAAVNARPGRKLNSNRIASVVRSRCFLHGMLY